MEEEDVLRYEGRSSRAYYRALDTLTTPGRPPIAPSQQITIQTQFHPPNPLAARPIPLS